MVYRQVEKQRSAPPNTVPLARPRGLLLQDQLTVTSLTERQAELSQARPCELSNLLVQVTGKPDRAGLNYLRAVDSWGTPGNSGIAGLGKGRDS